EVEFLGVEVAADGTPVQQEVGRGDGDTVGPGGVVIDRVLDLQRVVVDLLLGDEVGVVHQVQVTVVVHHLVVHQVVHDGVRRRVTRAAVSVVLVVRLVPADGDGGVLVDAGVGVVRRRRGA